MNYFYVLNHYEYESGFPVSSGHVIKTDSEEDAIKICEKYGIGCPFNRKIRIRNARLLNPEKYQTDFELIKRRKKGIGGKIFYEKNGKLKIEQNELRT